MTNAIVKRCELCKREVEEGARLCGPCAEMVERVRQADRAITPQDELRENDTSLERKSDRAQAKAQKLTPVILG